MSEETDTDDSDDDDVKATIDAVVEGDEEETDVLYMEDTEE